MMTKRTSKSIKFILLAIMFCVFFSVGLENLRSQEFFFDPTAKISMDFKDANIKDILKVFSVQSGANFIASSALQDRTLTLYLNNVAIEDAINQIFRANNLNYEFIEDSNIYIVKDMGGLMIETITRIYKLKYARIENSWIDNEVDQKLNPENAEQTTSTSIRSSSGTTGETEKEEFGLTKIIKRILTEHGKIVEDRRTNSLIITDIPANFTRIDAVITQLDVPAPQVLIEVEMLDVSKQTADEMGLDWSGVWMTLTGASRTTRFPFPNRMSDAYVQAAGMQQSQVGTIGGNAALGAAGALTNTTLVKAFTFGTLSAQALTAALRFIETKTDSKYLARPRIMCMNNELAEIKITTNESVGVTTGSLASQQSAAGAVTQISAPERAETGVKLRVAPQINMETGEITMYVEPSVKEAAAGNTISTAAGNFTYRDPEERSTKSTLRIRDGETIVIGGLLRTRDNEQVQEIPILSKIPFLGKLLFTYHVGGSGVNTSGPGRTDQRELLVFLTPRIIRDEATLRYASAKTENPLTGAPQMPISLPVREQAPLTQRQRTISDTLKNFE